MLVHGDLDWLLAVAPFSAVFSLEPVRPIATETRYIIVLSCILT
jgi:hypothetical protein